LRILLFWFSFIRVSDLCRWFGLDMNNLGRWVWPHFLAFDVVWIRLHSHRFNKICPPTYVFLAEQTKKARQRK
jgi:hypothetical protein